MHSLFKNLHNSKKNKVKQKKKFKFIYSYLFKGYNANNQIITNE